jgi:hypothetical protein
MRLDEYPRPADDNGLGIHFGLDLGQTSLDTYTQKMIELRLKWCLVAHEDESQLRRAAMVMSAAGILSVSRYKCQIDQNILDFTPFVQVLKDLHLPAYIQIFNEPSEEQEWRDGVRKPRVFTARWCDHAAQVAEAGGFPGLQVLNVIELRAVLSELKIRRSQNVIDHMWFCPHPYGANHPPDYPYDMRNQYDHPGATLATDDSTVLQFLEFSPIFEAELGFVPPFIAGEGGWQYKNSEDGRYSRIEDTTHARFHKALFDWFRTGLLSNGEPLPNYLFAFCPWILFGFEADAWFSRTTGTREPTIEAIKSIPNFVREFAAPVLTTAVSRPLHVLTHYVLFGIPSRSQRERLLLARDYLTRFNISFGFSVEEALRAQHVTLVGDHAMVSKVEEAKLKRGGCRVERLLGDEHALRIIFADRIERGMEFG